MYVCACVRVFVWNLMTDLATGQNQEDWENSREGRRLERLLTWGEGGKGELDGGWTASLGQGVYGVTGTATVTGRSLGRLSSLGGHWDGYRVTGTASPGQMSCVM